MEMQHDNKKPKKFKRSDKNRKLKDSASANRLSMRVSENCQIKSRSKSNKKSKSKQK